MGDSGELIIVLICCYNGKQHLDELISSLVASNEDQLAVRIVFVDDCSSDGSAEYIIHAYPEVECISTDRNYGFAGASNFGWIYISARYPEARYLVLLNQDTAVCTGWLTRLKVFMDCNPVVGAVQPKLLLWDDPTMINSVGSCSHYLGFGMMIGYREYDSIYDDVPRECAFASGCAVMVRVEALRKLGLFDATFYMYMEDVDLGWKLRQAGYQIWAIPTSEVLHKYLPNAHLLHYEVFERNRWIVIFTYYRLQTLCALFPAMMLTEIGQLVFAAMNGLLVEKLSAIAWFLKRRNVVHILERRRRAELHRKVDDRELLRLHVSYVHLPTGDPFALKWIANPLWKCCLAIARYAVQASTL